MPTSCTCRPQEAGDCFITVFWKIFDNSDKFLLYHVNCTKQILQKTVRKLSSAACDADRKIDAQI